MPISPLTRTIARSVTDKVVTDAEASDIAEAARRRGPQAANDKAELQALLRRTDIKFERRTGIVAMSPEGDVMLGRLDAKKTIRDEIKKIGR